MKKKTVSQRVDKQESTRHYNGSVRLDFDPVKHKYYIDGKLANGVTTALGIINKPQLIYWSARMASEYVKENIVPGEALDELEIQELVEGAKTAHRQRKDGAADRGTYVHNWIEEFVRTGEQPDMPINETLKEVIESFLSWWNRTKIKPITPEIKLCSPSMGLAGTADLLCEIDGKLTIVDWKTGSGIYTDMFYQLAAYAIMYKEEFGKDIDQLCIVNASIENMFKVKTVENSDLLRKTYLDALSLYKSNKQAEKELR